MMFSAKADGKSVGSQWATAAIWFRPAMILRRDVTIYHRTDAPWLSPCGMGYYDVTGWVGLNLIDAVTVELNGATAEDGRTRWQTHMRAILPLIKPSTAAAQYSALSRHGTTPSLQWRLSVMMHAEHFKSQAQIAPATASELRGPSSWPRQ
jgi:hypothetical protein